MSPRLRSRDVAALTGDRRWSDDRVEAVTAGEAPTVALAEWLRSDPAGCTSWLVRTGRLRAKVAFLTGDSAAPFSHYHEKLGVFVDPVGDVVAFSGSVNETGLAWDGNLEAADVFRSWRPADRPRVEAKVATFECLWSGGMPGVAVKPIEAALEDGLGLTHVWQSVKGAVARRLPTASNRPTPRRTIDPSEADVDRPSGHRDRAAS